MIIKDVFSDILLGLEEALPVPWPSQSDVARFLSVSRARVGQIVSKVVDRWASKDFSSSGQESCC